MTAPDKLDDEIPVEIDFSNGVRGKFFRPDAQINLPVYVDAGAESQWAVEIRRRIAALDAGAPTTAWADARKKIAAD